jgi:starch phosphorylase
MTRISAPKKSLPDEFGKYHPVDKAQRDTYDRHLVFDHVVATENASQRERFEAVSRSLRDLLTPRCC